MPAGSNGSRPPQTRSPFFSLLAFYELAQCSTEMEPAIHHSFHFPISEPIITLKSTVQFKSIMFALLKISLCIFTVLVTANSMQFACLNGNHGRRSITLDALPTSGQIISNGFESDLTFFSSTGEHKWGQQLAQRTNCSQTPTKPQQIAEFTTQVWDLTFNTKDPPQS